MGRDTFHDPRLFHALSNLAWNTPRDGRETKHRNSRVRDQEGQVSEEATAEVEHPSNLLSRTGDDTKVQANCVFAQVVPHIIILNSQLMTHSITPKPMQSKARDGLVLQLFWIKPCVQPELCEDSGEEADSKDEALLKAQRRQLKCDKGLSPSLAVSKARLDGAWSSLV
ncbi:hypothetical protein DUI87_27714 [Hirundo rustica rustica]|uniref:Uncharacterized protein n=1 Tax=Hirundo rustica rustica TaxID=333673 RepID=A0A3M0J9N9_HIRRU|nr:hypothetical protein DUI87_27714 [Hirundo rustica rustica]